VPDPPIALRPWRPGDAAALAAAWADPDIARWTRVPAESDEAAAARWIAGWDERRRRGIALDLVIVDRCDAVLGEVGVSFVAQPATIGWWVMPGWRRRGIATRAVRLFVTQVLPAAGVDEVIAEVGSDNPASAAVARAAGFTTVAPGRWALRYHHDRP
jgi:RimJ/RimL family protein N-acetyltransferase